MGAAASASDGSGTGALSFAAYVARGQLPPPDALKHEDVFDKYFYDAPDCHLDPDGPTFPLLLQCSALRHPLRREEQTLLLGIFLRCKYDGQHGFRAPGRFVVVFDASGSTSRLFDAGRPGLTRRGVAREALGALLADGGGFLPDDELTVIVTGRGQAAVAVARGPLADAREAALAAVDAEPGVGAADWAATAGLLGAELERERSAPVAAAEVAAADFAANGRITTYTPAEQVAAFLGAHGFGDEPGLRDFCGADLLSVRREELVQALGLRGARLFNLVQTAARQPASVSTAPTSTAASGRAPHVLVFSDLASAPANALGPTLARAQARSLWLTSDLALPAAALQAVRAIKDATPYQLVPGDGWLERLSGDFEYLVCPTISDVRIHVHGESLQPAGRLYGFESARGAPVNHADGEVCALGEVRPSDARGSAVKGGVLLVELRRVQPTGKRWRDSGALRVAVEYTDLDGSRRVDVHHTAFPAELPPLIDEEGQLLRSPEPVPDVCGGPAMLKAGMLFLYVNCVKEMLMQRGGALQRSSAALVRFFEEQAAAIGDDALQDEVRVWMDLTDALPELRRCVLM